MNPRLTIPQVNIASALELSAQRTPNTRAVLEPLGRDWRGRQQYRTYSYRELDSDSTRIARGLIRCGITPGSRVALMVKPSYELFALVFALFKAGIVPVLIDPGIGISNMGICLTEAKPSAFIGVTAAHIARTMFGWSKGTIATLVTVGKRLGWGGFTLDEVRQAGHDAVELAEVKEHDVAAVLFTSGSTGVPKGAVYTHGNFAAQVQMLKQMFDFQPGEIDLPTFPLFALFDPALGMTTVLPYMDATRPAQVDPLDIIEPIHQFQITNMFGSPALLRRVGTSAVGRFQRLPSLRRVISAGAPVPTAVIERFSSLLSEGAKIYTPYGATEALPVALISSDSILEETRWATDRGEGVCVGDPVEGIEVATISITDDAIAQWDENLRVAQGQVGEIAVKGPNVTANYFQREKATELAKIPDPRGGFWHRMGDLGRFDSNGRLWFYGRKGHRVQLSNQLLFTDSVEGVFNTHPDVFRSALVGVTQGENTRAVLCIELEPGTQKNKEVIKRELAELAQKYPHTSNISTFLFHKAFPVDIRHNSKIFREKLAVWAQEQMR